MGKLTVGALRAVLVVVLAGTVFVQALMVWALVSGSDPENGSLPLTTLRELGFGGEVAGFYHRYRHGCPEPAIDVLAAFGFSTQDPDDDAEPGGAGHLRQAGPGAGERGVAEPERRRLRADRPHDPSSGSIPGTRPGR
jgi:hypothetical protein